MGRVHGPYVDTGVQNEGRGHGRQNHTREHGRPECVPSLRIELSLSSDVQGQQLVET